jgi:DNA (cytosine-5)-methyltransferase 1
MSLSGVDLFAGAGGWDVYCTELGIDVLGIETDGQACETRAAAGFRTLQADVSKLDPADYPCDVLIASPPCTAFSMAGKGKGRDALTVFATAIQRLRAGASLDRDWLDSQCDDPTAHLVLEPLRWALALQPEWIAFEQVPPVLPLWRLMDDVLRERGYSTWTGVLEAERFGVPQTRERAILMASRTGQHVSPPVPTHQRYVSGEPARHEMTLDGELLPWVSMADALGWGMTARPGLSISHAGQDGGSGARASIERERERESVDRSATGSRGAQAFQGLFDNHRTYADRQGSAPLTNLMASSWSHPEARKQGGFGAQNPASVGGRS